MNNWALITGASAGIGSELAKIFAAHGFNLALVSRNEARLHQLADDLTNVHRIQTDVIAKDLSQAGAAQEIFEALKGREISVLVNNAGFGSYGEFAGTSLAVHTEMVQVNLVAVMQLTHLFLTPMLARRSGRILNVASTAAFQPGPTMSTYYAGKAFVYSLSYALAVELAGTGVTVTALCPGMTRTEFFGRARIAAPGSFLMMEPRRVAELGYQGLMRGKRVVIPGAFNQILAFLAKRTPPRVTSAIVRRLHSLAGQ